jgi:hypothetical protein
MWCTDWRATAPSRHRSASHAGPQGFVAVAASSRKLAFPADTASRGSDLPTRCRTSVSAGGRLAAITAAERFPSDPLRCLALGRETWHGMNLRPFEKGAMRKKPE